jgi:ABC-2 type transport system ATP-binding protein/lipopolysaccharide transport system ATP-binding protein
MNSAVSVQHVTKSFKLQEEHYSTIRELFLKSLFFWKRKQIKPLVALDDISFEVPRGQTLGIIGDNGSGKSTLLKLILGITPPTTGSIQVNGKIAALLELGAGFHPDLTGRENIYLNGSILGITKKMLDEKMEEIIDFAELRPFIDSPIKHYSSGMFVRLGFSIAVHVNPDVLLVDEVLAVGDGAFQQKCIEKIKEFQRDGKTIILVSHDLGMVEKTCQRAILVKNGHILMDDKAKATVKVYYEKIMEQRMALARKYAEVQIIPTKKVGYRSGTGEIKITKVRILNGKGEEKYLFDPGDPLTVEIEYEAEQPVENPVFGLGWANEDGIYLNGSNTNIRKIETGIVKGKGTWRVHYPHFTLQQGKYLLSPGIYREPISEETAYDYHACQYSIFVSLGNPGDEAVIHIPQDWEIKAE